MRHRLPSFAASRKLGLSYISSLMQLRVETRSFKDDAKSFDQKGISPQLNNCNSAGRPVVNTGVAPKSKPFS